MSNHDASSEPGTFQPIGESVKTSIEASPNCNETTSKCEVPDFEFLSDESNAGGDLANLKNLLAENDVQLLQCSGKIIFNDLRNNLNPSRLCTIRKSD